MTMANPKNDSDTTPQGFNVVKETNSLLAEKRYGRFSITMSTLKGTKPETLLKVMSKVIITSCTYCSYSHKFEYGGYSEEFVPTDGVRRNVPEYVVVVTTEEGVENVHFEPVTEYVHSVDLPLEF